MFCVLTTVPDAARQLTNQKCVSALLMHMYFFLSATILQYIDVFPFLPDDPLKVGPGCGY
jgi:hypothetical protein